MTLPKVQALERALKAGFSASDLRRVFEAIKASDPEGRGLASFCQTKNRAFEYSVRPTTLQAILDELEVNAAGDPAPPPCAADLPLTVPELAL